MTTKGPDQNRKPDSPQGCLIFHYDNASPCIYPSVDRHSGCAQDLAAIQAFSNVFPEVHFPENGITEWQEICIPLTSLDDAKPSCKSFAVFYIRTGSFHCSLSLPLLLYSLSVCGSKEGAVVSHDIVSFHCPDSSHILSTSVFDYRPSRFLLLWPASGSPFPAPCFETLCPPWSMASSIFQLYVVYYKYSMMVQ